ncbi:L,D-transpeptidase [Streptomyces sp. NBC_00038]|uniref:L,D-transpeptidase n=1 Tax=Streptomyces sp. NBC_00038 TaxID=2903615 RepID=UPI002256E6E8|nr:L,D-transpeptidase [Streptomyces sp. NBC_00038]MCX5559197.1 L,D-transpeptidase [Streptomyces sp. NBC_00038]
MSDELTSELRELAVTGETPPPLSGAEIRGRAVRRRRHRRTAAVVVGASAAAALALVVALNLGGGDTNQHPSPAASPTGRPTTPATADAVVDLSRRVVTVAGRELPLSSGSAQTPTPADRMTVTARVTMKLIPAEELGYKGYDLKVPWFIELRAADGKTNYIAGLAYDEKAPGNYDLTSGWIGLRESDAEWLYGQLKEGSVVDIEGTAPTPTPVSTPTVTSPTDTATVGP